MTREVKRDNRLSDILTAEIILPRTTSLTSNQHRLRWVRSHVPAAFVPQEMSLVLISVKTLRDAGN